MSAYSIIYVHKIDSKYWVGLKNSGLTKLIVALSNPIKNIDEVHLKRITERKSYILEELLKKSTRPNKKDIKRKAGQT